MAKVKESTKVRRAKLINDLIEAKWDWAQAISNYGDSTDYQATLIYSAEELASIKASAEANCKAKAAAFFERKSDLFRELGIDTTGDEFYHVRDRSYSEAV